jgi:hypothetical protein
MRDASCTVALHFGPLVVVIRVAVQRKLREVFGSGRAQGLRRGVGRSLKRNWRKHWGCWRVLYHDGCTSVCSWPTRESWSTSSRDRCLVELLQTKNSLNYKHTPSPYRAVNTLRLVVKTSQLTLCREIIAVCSEIHSKHINSLWRQKVELLNVKLAVYVVTTVRYI